MSLLQRYADIESLRQRLPLDDPDRHALDLDADIQFAELAPATSRGSSREQRLAALLAEIRALGGRWSAGRVQRRRRAQGGAVQRGTARRDLRELARRGFLIAHGPVDGRFYTYRKEGA